MPERAAFRRRVGGLVVLLAAAALLAASDPAHAVVRQGFEQARLVIVAHPTLGKVVFVLASVLSAMLAFFSSAVIVPVAVYAWGEATTLALLWGAWWIGGAASYLVGRTLGRRVAAWAISPARVDYYAARITARAGFPTILLFQLALPSEIPGYVLGMVRCRIGTYLAALALAELPFALGAVYLGESFVRGDYALLVGLGVAGIACSATAFHHLHRRIGGGQQSP
ncbi:MAG TPA: VTT domain-containing protein [Gemmatimonadales bacterium]|nr:VTT domain-containing protein [Gemmatimonadales bacterium]